MFVGQSISGGPHLTSYQLGSCIFIQKSFTCISPLGSKAPSSWLGDILQKQGISFLIKKFEGGGSEDENLSGISSHPTLYDLQGTFSLQAVMQWMDMFLAALDCYNTFIEQGMIKAHEVLGR